MLVPEMFKSNVASLEAIEDEKEFTWFMKLSDLSELEQATRVEKMLQDEYFLTEAEGSKKRIGLQRTREVALGTAELGDEANEITLTIKIFDDEGGNRGSVCNINRDVQKAFNTIAHRRIDKIRYTFAIPNSDLIWEIDLSKGVTDGWVKVDLEVDSFDIEIPDFPLAVDQVIDVSHGKKVTDAESETLTQIFKQINGK